MPLRDKLTKIGEVTLPVYALVLRGAPNLAGFTFFRFADCMATVSDGEGDEERDIGSIGGIVGAHYLAHINRDGGSETEAELIIDVSEAWDAFLGVLDSATAQAIIKRLQAECTERFERKSAATREAVERRKRKQLEAELAELEATEKELIDANA